MCSADRFVRFARSYAALAVAALFPLPVLSEARTPSVEQVGSPIQVGGVCDASAAVPTEPEGFNEFLVWDDEQDTPLRIDLAGNKRSIGLPSDSDRELEHQLDRHSKKGEADFEGSTWLDGYVFVIGSLGRNESGERKERREQLVSLAVTRPADRGLALQVADGTTPYVRLLNDLHHHLSFLRRHIDLASPKDAMLAPERFGLSVEGLAAGQDGRSLLVGLRNPLTIEGSAIVVPIENPFDLVAGRSPAKLGPPAFFDLDNRGIRSLERLPAAYGGVYLILAGPTGDGTDFSLFTWSGRSSDKALEIDSFKDVLRAVPDLRPEGMVASPAGDQLLLFSDDGERLVGHKQCKHTDDAQKSFRMMLLRLKWS